MTTTQLSRIKKSRLINKVLLVSNIIISAIVSFHLISLLFTQIDFRRTFNLAEPYAMMILVFIILASLSLLTYTIVNLLIGIYENTVDKP